MCVCGYEREFKKENIISKFTCEHDQFYFKIWQNIQTFREYVGEFDEVHKHISQQNSSECVCGLKKKIDGAVYRWHASAT